MKVSLIVGTTGRRCEQIGRLLESIAGQTHRDIEVVIVIQGSHEIDEVVGPFRSSVDVRVERIQRYGLSHARNVGSRIACGEILAFPDDDCFYGVDTVGAAVQRLVGCNRDVVVGSIHDPCSLAPFFRYPGECISMKRRQLWLAPSIAIFIRAHSFERVRGFDEDFGLGACYPSAEETDLLVRVAACSPVGSVVFDPMIRVYHRKQGKCKSDLFYERRERAYGMNRGWGALIRKHLRRDYVYWLGMLWVLLARRFSGMVYHGILKGDSHALRYYAGSCRALITGFMGYRPADGRRV